jgi:hypothetical protein
VVQALSIATYLFVGRLGEFYLLAVVFGTAYGGVMPLYAVLAREYFAQRVMGTVFGAATMTSSLDMSLTPHFHPLGRPRSMTADFRKCDYSDAIRCARTRPQLSPK